MSYPPPPPPPPPGPGPYQPPQQQPYQQPYQQQPYAYGGGQPPYQPPPPQKKGRGCLIGGLIALVVVLVVCGVGGFFVWRVADKVKDTVESSVPGLGGAECPTAKDVSDTIGYDVELDLNANIVVAAGCNYSGSGVGVTMIKGANLISDDEMDAVRQEAANAGVEPRSIDTGDGGIAFGSPQRSEAIAKSDVGLVEVDIFAEGTDDIGDKSDEAIDLLEQFIDLQ
ncbi:MAG TPA: hypothetical protein VNS55_12905 [Nocardioides sp.]|nr:hypothetical protein [Nocardioides sp.]